MSTSGSSLRSGSVIVSPLVWSGGVKESSGSGVPTIAGAIGDIFWRTNGGVGSTLYRCTTAGGAGAAVWSAIL